MITHAYVNDKKISIKDFKKLEHVNPVCSMGHPLIAKKGQIMVHHFAHAKGFICDSWRQGAMTNWHAQWQFIVDDPRNLEVCMSSDGTIIGHSSFSGQTMMNGSNPQMLNLTTTAHIADIIKPSPIEGCRPSVIEIQHSPIDFQNIQDREKYYKDMIWVFDFTPRKVNPKVNEANNNASGGYNKIIMIDGKLTCLMEKVTYMAVLTCKKNTINKLNKYTGDLDYTSRPFSGLFVVVHSQTKYWFQTSTPTYFDCGFGMLRLLHVLEKGFALTQFISYALFFQERMPPLNYETVNSCDWFKDFPNIMDLCKLDILPHPIDVDAISIAKDRIEVLYSGSDLGELGFSIRSTTTYPNGVWAAGSYYTNLIPPSEYKHRIVNTIKAEEEYIAHQSIRDLMNAALDGKDLPVVGATVKQPESTLSYEVFVIERLRKFLGLRPGDVPIEVVAKGKMKTVILTCNGKTYALKDKFKMLGMTYKSTKSRGKGSSAVKIPATFSLELSRMDVVLKSLHI